MNTYSRPRGDICVAVPVRNEVARLPRLLRSLARQAEAPAFSVAFYFDNCCDGSLELVEQFKAELPYEVTCASSHVERPPNAGFARSQALRFALELSPRLLLSTDADSEPATGWIAENVLALDRAEIVAGRIVMDGHHSAARQDRITRYFDRLHALRRHIDPVPWEDRLTHHWFSATSLGFSASTYLRLGGMAPIPSGEDAAFGDAAARAGLRVRRDARITVSTSTRRDSRANGGFGTGLIRLDTLRDLPPVTDPRVEVWRFEQHALARQAYDAGVFTPLARTLRLPVTAVDAIAQRSFNSEAFAAKVVGAPPKGMRLLDFAQAESVLDALWADERKGAA